MRHITSDDLKRIMDLVSVPIEEDRLKHVAPLLNQALEKISALDKVNLTKEIEPSSYLHKIVTRDGG